MFCEVGKRFGGGAIPELIQYSFGINILEKYWRSIDHSDKVDCSEHMLLMPAVIATSYSPYLREGVITKVPEKKYFNWTALCPVKYTDQIDKNFRRLGCGIVPRSSRFCLCKRVWY